MNIESTKAVLMPLVHQAPAIQKLSSYNEEPLQPSASARSPVPVRVAEVISQSASLDLENRKRIEIVERAMGMNKALIVEKDEQRVGFIYKTIDKSTGEVTRIWPQREVASALIALADGDARAIMQGMMVDALA